MPRSCLCGVEPWPELESSETDCCFLKEMRELVNPLRFYQDLPEGEAASVMAG